MTPEAQRIAIAEACGWSKQEIEGLQSVKPYGATYRLGRPIPDYLNDLNACHEMEKVMSDKQKGIYAHSLVGAWGRAWDATAAQRAEAFLKTLGLWK